MSTSVTRIMLFGTFDGLHAGHIFLFNKARSLAENPFVIVSIARDKNVLRIKNRLPDNDEHGRKLAVKQTGLVHKVVLGGIKNHIPHILREKPHIIVLGYDQEAYTENLQQTLLDNGLKVIIHRLPSYKPEKYKSSKIRLKRLKEKSKQK